MAGSFAAIMVVLAAGLTGWLGWWRGATARAAHLAMVREQVRQHERARYSRMLHDRVLQTLEVLAVSPEIRDPTLRGYLADEVDWLRRLVENGVTQPDSDLITELARCVRRRPLRPVEATFDVAAGLRLAELPSVAVNAVVGAVTEALTNAAKHVDHARAAVRLRTENGGVVVTVTDNGPGFEPDDTTGPGFGLTHSISGRMAAVGGTGRVYTARVGGTIVELTYPARTGTSTAMPR